MQGLEPPPIEECFQMLCQAIMASEKVGKHSFIGDDWSLFFCIATKGNTKKCENTEKEIN